MNKSYNFLFRPVTPPRRQSKTQREIAVVRNSNGYSSAIAGYFEMRITRFRQDLGCGPLHDNFDAFGFFTSISGRDRRVSKSRWRIGNRHGFTKKKNRHHLLFRGQRRSRQWKPDFVDASTKHWVYAFFFYLLTPKKVLSRGFGRVTCLRNFFNLNYLIERTLFINTHLALKLTDSIP